MKQKRYYPIVLAVIVGLSMFFFGAGLPAEDITQADVNIVLPNGAVSQSHAVEVGDTLVLHGLPFPLHKLNGAELHFPEGSLNEEVRIEISLPDFSTISEETPKEVGFGEMIANAISVKVYVDDELVSPYHFEEPVELNLPIPENMPQGIGEDVSQFILAYMDEEGEGIDTEEIKTVFRDEVNRFVRAEVGHFSNIVMTSLQDPVTADRNGEIPTHVTLEQNYPNPFNPETVIRFDLPQQAEVRLEIVNVLGQTVTVLRNETMPAGSHESIWNASDQPSGVYLYRLQVDDYSITRSLTLLK
ncbi:MAG: T9SS type A sorting domain-containing protein [Cyclonatronaceae bacterium]